MTLRLSRLIAPGIGVLKSLLRSIDFRLQARNPVEIAIAQSRMAAARRTGGPAFFEGFVDACARGGNGRDQTAEQAGEKRQQKGETDHLPVKTDGADARKRLRQKANARPEHDRRQSQTEQPASDA